MKYLKGVTTLALDRERCTGCGECVAVCPHGVLAVSERKAAIVDRDSCMECGACRRNCPTGAVHVQPGVGCAYAILKGMLSGTAPDCGCGSKTGGCC
jgi:NAD-dependent dihydropyrimidine dehydrogenase PreA subunit